MALYSRIKVRAEVRGRWQSMKLMAPPTLALVLVDPDDFDSEDAVLQALHPAQAMICLPYGGVVVTTELVSKLPNLKHVQLLSAGFSEVAPDVAGLKALVILLPSQTHTSKLARSLCSRTELYIPAAAGCVCRQQWRIECHLGL